MRLSNSADLVCADVSHDSVLFEFLISVDLARWAESRPYGIVEISSSEFFLEDGKCPAVETRFPFFQNPYLNRRTRTIRITKLLACVDAGSHGLIVQ